ncbi:epimerase [Chryseobacterium shigense]|uniref:Nucleoside-diphosphate-sugar epimerase n=1 Tax=Chryseobacterium shigense TaxID=297244 RepID=A0A1N7IKA4_9FLAO|nr:NAD-dependent epimerase/dehydratase family protein [Chryseobacterium shigense]PQA95873.1 epimerase [Chryseobacterium shigense]SIS37515.1 Nucleoside-diphosphate-sugar epimerase [Chryseobacterium shigense]
MKIAIFGGSGFVGKNLIKTLQSKFDIQEISLRNSFWQKTIDKETDIMINLVGKAHDHKGTATEKDYYFANVELARQIVEEFKKSDASLLIHVSSIAALEELGSDKPLEEIDHCRPLSLYGKTKREAEKLLLDEDLPKNKKIIIIRPPMIHGPGDKGNLGLLYKMISKGIPYPLASFENNRSFLSIENFCYYVEEIIKKKSEISSGIYHICDDESVSTKDIIEIIGEVTRKKTVNLSLPKVIVQKMAKIGDYIPFPLNTKRLKKMTSNLLVSNEKIKMSLGVEKLSVSAKDGLIKTIKSFQTK